MSNINKQFLDCNLNPLSSVKALFTPQVTPQVTGSFQTDADSFQLLSDVTGTFSTGSVANLYSVAINKPVPATNFFLQTTETGSYIYSGSTQTGSAQVVYFNLFDSLKNPSTVKTLTLTPKWSYPFIFSGSIIALSATSSVPDSTGSVYFNSLVPGPYQVDVFGKVDATWFISVPPISNSGSLNGSWNAKDLRIVKLSKVIPVKVSNIDTSYALSISSSDARYLFRGDVFQPISCSIAANADFASLAAVAISSSFSTNAYTSSNAITSSFALRTPATTLNTGSTYQITASQSVSSSWSPNQGATTLSTGSTFPITASWANNVLNTASFSVSASWSPNQGATTLNTGSTYPLTASWANNFKEQATFLFTGSTYPITASAAISASWAPQGTILTSGSVYNVTSSWSNASVNSVTASFSLLSATASYFVEKATVLNTGSTFPITASWAVSAGSSVSSSWSPNQGATTLSTGSTYQITASQSVSASYAPEKATFLNTGSLYPITASSAVSASWAPQGTVLTSGSTYNVTASWARNAISSSAAVNSTLASQSLVSDFAPLASVAISSSFATFALNSPATTLFTGSAYPITSSWTNNSISSSYARNADAATLCLGSISSSYTQTASYALGPAQLATGSIYFITASAANYCNNQTNSVFWKAVTIIPDPGTDGAYFQMKNTAGLTSTLHVNDFGFTMDNDLYGQTIHGSFSGDGTLVTNVAAVTAVSSSYATSASYSPATLSSSYSKNASSASLSTTASFSTSASYASTALSASYSIANQVSSSFATTASFANVAGSANSVAGATVTGTVPSATSASYSVSSSYASAANSSATTISASYISGSKVDGYVAFATFASVSQIANTAIITGKLSGLNYNTASFPALPITSSSAIILSDLTCSANLTGTFYRAEYDYAIVSGSNARFGTVYGGWNGTTVSYTEDAAPDIGNTSPFTFSMLITGSRVQLIGTVAGTSNGLYPWVVRVAATYI